MGECLKICRFLKNWQKTISHNQIDSTNYYQKTYTKEKIKEVLKKLKNYKKLEKYYLKKFVDPVYENYETKILQNKKEDYKESILEGIWISHLQQKFIDRIKNQGKVISNWPGFIKKHIEGIISDLFPEELWLVDSGFREPINIENIRKIRKFHTEIKHLETLSKNRRLESDEIKRLHFIHAQKQKIKDVLLAPGTGELKDDPDDFEHPFFNKSHDYIDLDAFENKSRKSNGLGNREHLLNPEERLIIKQQREIKESNQSVCNARERQIIKLRFKCDLTFKAISFIVEPKSKKELSFKYSVDLEFFIQQIKVHQRPFEKRLWGSLSISIKGLLEKGGSVTNKEKAKLIKYLEDYFRKRDCFTEKELKMVGLTHRTILCIFDKGFNNLSEYEILQINLIAISKIFPDKYYNPETGKKQRPVKGLLTIERLKQMQDNAVKKLKKIGDKL